MGKLTGIDRRQVIQLHSQFKWTAEEIAQRLELDVEAVKEAMPMPYHESMLDVLRAAPDGMVELGEASPVWAVAASNPEADGFYYTFKLMPHDLWVCTCRGFRYRQKCRHVEKLSEKPLTAKT